jgi:hypothetical protein
MKTIVLFIASIFSLNAVNAQFSENFDGVEAGLTSNCWTLNDVHRTTNPQDVINGTGSMYTNPPTNNSTTRDIFTPYLNITSTSLTISFNYKVSSVINGNATRTIEVGISNAPGNFTSLALITLDKNSPATVLSFNQSFTLASTGPRKVVLKLGGSNGDGNSRLIFDDLYVSANPLYGTGTCNTAPIAVNDTYSGLIGSVITGNIMSNDNEPNEETMTPSISLASPDGIVVLNPTGSFIFTPAPGFLGTTTSFTYYLTDNGYDPMTSNIATVTISYFTSSPLPVKLIGFDAKYNKPDVQLTWSTAQEKNFSHFILEQSNDGTNFNEIAMVFGAGESDVRKDYSYTDRTVVGRQGLVYYRLVSVDVDGKTSYSSVRIIRLGDEKPGISLSAFPNPVINELKVTIPSTWQNRQVNYTLYNVNGQIIRTIQNASSSQTETISMSNMAPGFYVVKAVCGTETAQQRIVKQ